MKLLNNLPGKSVRSGGCKAGKSVLKAFMQRHERHLKPPQGDANVDSDNIKDIATVCQLSIRKVSVEILLFRKKSTWEAGT